MANNSFPRRERKDEIRAVIGRLPSSYSRYTDPAIFPRFGGDEFDPPPYSMDRRSTIAPSASSGPHHGILNKGFAMLAEVALFIADLFHRKLNPQSSHSALPR